eukprot:370009-Amphidinium_carterae.2
MGPLLFEGRGMEPLLFEGREHAVLEAKTLYVQCSQLGGGIVYGLSARQHKSNLNTCINQAHIAYHTVRPSTFAATSSSTSTGTRVAKSLLTWRASVSSAV